MRQFARNAVQALMTAGAIGALAGTASAQAQEATPAATTPPPKQRSQAGNPSPEAGEIVVTATRREETLSKVPISISAFGAQKLDKLGVKSFADVVRYTPGISTTTDNTHEIAIRGVSSNAGASTTGIYIDDTPIQIRQLGLNSNNAQPIIFDLDRIEVLRGPQGTLFGAGSEGGTVRFITPGASTTQLSLTTHAELAATEHGSPSYEGEAIANVPLAKDKLGIRFGAYYRKDGGYINHEDPYTFKTLKDTDWVKSFVAFGTLTWKPSDSVTITSNVQHQNRNNNNTDVAGYFVGLSNPGADQFTEATANPLTDHDGFTVASLKAEWRGEGVRLISDTSYFKRHEDVNGYEGTIYNLSYFQHSFDPRSGNLVTPQGTFPVFGADPSNIVCNNAPASVTTQFGASPGACTLNASFLGASGNGANSPLLTATGISQTFAQQYFAAYGTYYRSPNVITNTQENFTQELRLQSDNASRLSWTLGAFYSKIVQDSDERIIDPGLDNITQLLFGENIISGWAVDLAQPGNLGYENKGHGHEWQLAGYVDATYKITDSVKVNGGLRVARTHFDFTNDTRGPEAFGERTSSGGISETPVTPKINISWQITRDDMIYATASKGYRVGGANAPLLQACGVPSAPLTFKSDSLWNYEIGTKAKTRDGKFRFSASAYDIEWNNIQQSVYVGACGQQFVANLGKARSQGLDFEAEVHPVQRVGLNLAVGYTHARYIKDSFLPGAAATETTQATPQLTIAYKGDAIAGAPLTVSAGVQYDYTVGGHDGFIRIDDEYAAHLAAHTIQTDARTDINGNNLLSYDPALVTDPDTNQASIRLGLTTGTADWALFVNNLFDEHPRLGYTHSDSTTDLFNANTFRPRTWGLSLTMKY